MLEIIDCNSFDDKKIKIISDLATEIWHEHYDLTHGKPKIDYMLENFQSKNAVKQQIKEGFLYYLLKLDQEYIGYAGIYPDKNSLFLSKIYIKSSYRGKGAGKQAISFIENIARQKNLQAIELTVANNNTESIKAYERLGFAIVDAIVKDIGSGFVMDDYVMRKHVDN